MLKRKSKDDKQAGQNNRGFTLVEVLGTVVILSVLVLLVVPSVSKYIYQGKDSFNEKLKSQLLLLGKEYYSENTQKLPVKIGNVYRNGKDYSVVTLPEMQSENLVSKDFVDSEGRSCKESYVYVRHSENGKDYDYHPCLRCTGEYGEIVNYSDDDEYCKGSFESINKYEVNVVVEKGTVDVSKKYVEKEKDITFNLTPNVTGATSTVTCTNNQTGTITNNILTVSNVSSDTTCTVKFVDTITVLYNDGTLIINESSANRSSNITKHGTIEKEYEALSDSNSYVWGSGVDTLWYSEKNQITNVEIGQEISPISTAYWFSYLENMKKGDFTNLDASNVTNMSYMFFWASNNATTFKLTGFDDWNTSKVTNMRAMFYRTGNSATTWSVGDLSRWDTSKVTDMYGMFDYAGRSATTWNIGNLSNWNTSNVTDMYGMFVDAGKSATTWNIGDISNWDVSNVTDMSFMFRNVGYSATTWSIGDLSNWDTSSVTSMEYMFDNAGKSATTWSIGSLSKWDTQDVTDMAGMFSSAGYNATTWSVGDLSNWDTSNVTDMYGMFVDTGKSATTWNIGDISKWDTSKVTNMGGMFYWAGRNAKVFNLDLSKWDTSKVTSFVYDNDYKMFYGAGKNATTWSVKIPKKTGSLTNTKSKFYGSSSSIYAEPRNGRTFTLASS